MVQSINNNFFIDAMITEQRIKHYSEKRKSGMFFANFMIVDCECDNWWYSKYIDTVFFGEIWFKNYGRGDFIYDVYPVYLTETTILRGRSISIKDLIMI